MEDDTKKIKSTTPVHIIREIKSLAPCGGAAGSIC